MNEGEWMNGMNRILNPRSTHHERIIKHWVVFRFETGGEIIMGEEGVVVIVKKEGSMDDK